jgi:protoporphyrin/coproporphyrin ferrochelatase
MSDVAVVLMAYGSPRAPDEIEPYYTDIRRGRPPTPELLAELTARYEAIGGLSPLTERTEAQRVALGAALETLAPGRYRVEIGLKHAEPGIETTVDRVAIDGVDAIVGLVLAPHYSAYSVGQYLDRMERAAAAHGIATAAVRSWATEPAFVDFIADDLRARLDAAPPRRHVFFTAHSLPERILSTADAYPDELRATAEAVATQLDLTEGADWSIAWQSAGRTPEPWLGPDILEAIDARRELDPGVDAVIVAAVGFVSDHLEVLYDLDIEAARRAAELGLGFDRTACVNDDPTVMAALAQRIHRAAAELDG